MIPVVVAQIDRQKEKVENWREHALYLDPSAPIDIVPVPHEIQNLPVHEGQYASFRFICDRYSGNPFFWMEADAIPLTKEWYTRPIEEYSKSQRAFLLPSISGLHWQDHASGIGIYSGHSADIFPKDKPPPPIYSWDHWLYQNWKSLICFTKSIQHSYGVYLHDGQLLRRHVFPPDRDIIRKEAVIFHSDPNQGLIPRKYYF